MLIILNKTIFIKSFLTRVLHDYFKLIYAYLNEGDKVCKCYSCLKTIVQAYLHVGFFAIFFIKSASRKRLYLAIYEPVAIKHNF